jgi:hypothetical protein
VYRVTNQRTGAVFADKIISKEIFKRRRTAKEKVQDNFGDPDLVGSGTVQVMRIDPRNGLSDLCSNFHFVLAKFLGRIKFHASSGFFPHRGSAVLHFFLQKSELLLFTVVT